MALPSLDTSIFARQTYDGATVSEAFIKSYREAQKIAMDKEQMAKDNALTDEKTQWLREDRQRQKEVLDPIEEERAKLGITQDKLQLERQRFQLKSQRRDAEAELSTLGAMETNDGLGDELIGKLASLSQSAPGDPANDGESFLTLSQDVTSAQVSAAIDRLGGYVDAQAKAQAKASAPETTSAYTLWLMLNDPNVPAATKEQAKALLQQQLQNAAGMPKGSGAMPNNPLLPPVSGTAQPASVKEMSTDALRKLTGK